MVFLLAKLIVPLVKDRIRLAREEITGYGGRITCALFIDDIIVFAIFIVVHSPLQRSSGIATHPCRTRSSLVANPGAASFSTTFHQRVGDVLNR
jgi:hypothetical protein